LGWLIPGGILYCDFLCNSFLLKPHTFYPNLANNRPTLLTHVVRLRMRIEKKEGRAFVYTEGMNRAGRQEDSVILTDNILIVLWKTY